MPNVFLEKYKKETTIEGLYTTKSFYDLLKKEKISCPIINIIYNILYKNESPMKLIEYFERD